MTACAGAAALAVRPTVCAGAAPRPGEVGRNQPVADARTGSRATRSAGLSAVCRHAEPASARRVASATPGGAPKPDVVVPTRIAVGCAGCAGAGVGADSAECAGAGISGAVSAAARGGSSEGWACVGTSARGAAGAAGAAPPITDRRTSAGSVVVSGAAGRLSGCAGRSTGRAPGCAWGAPTDGIAPPAAASEGPLGARRAGAGADARDADASTVSACAS